MNDLSLAAGKSLTVAFVKNGDRYQQRVFWQDRLVLSTVETGDEENPANWPASPPFQEVHIEPSPGKSPTALFVGRAGTSHWSMSLETDPAAQCLTFDVACRLKERPEFLGSTWQVHEPFTMQLMQCNLAAIIAISEKNASARVELAPLAESAGSRGMESCSVTLKVQNAQAILMPGLLTDNIPNTARWRYQIRTIP